MYSTKFQVGLREDNAPKKVTRQGHGAHTDIFGTTEPVQATPKKNIPETHIQNILMEQTDCKTEVKEKNEIIGIKNQKENEVENENESTQTQVPRRIRMPPGGFSSGLW